MFFGVYIILHSFFFVAVNVKMCAALPLYGHVQWQWYLNTFCMSYRRCVLIFIAKNNYKSNQLTQANLMILVSKLLVRFTIKFIDFFKILNSSNYTLLNTVLKSFSSTRHQHPRVLYLYPNLTTRSS